MGLFSSKKSVSSSQTIQSDERVAASDFATVVRAEEGATVSIGATADQLSNLLQLREGPRFEAEREALNQRIAGSGIDITGGAGLVLAAGVGLVLILMFRRS